MKSLTEGQLGALLREKYPKEQYALLRQCRNGTGGAACRSADALVMSLWPSRGLDLHGFEFKSARGDWLRELKTPEKAEPIAKFCDFWWIVIGNSNVAHHTELPTTWGLLCPNEAGTKLEMLKTPTKMAAQPMNREFLGAILRKAQEDAEKPNAEAIAKAVELRIEEAVKRERDFAAGQHRHVLESRDRFRSDILEFKMKTGIDIYARTYGFHGDWSSAVAFAMKGGINQHKQALESLLMSAHQIAKSIETQLRAEPIEPDYSI